MTSGININGVFLPEVPAIITVEPSLEDIQKIGWEEALVAAHEKALEAALVVALAVAVEQALEAALEAALEVALEANLLTLTVFEPAIEASLTTSLEIALLVTKKGTFTITIK